jgi:signal transduction histidine kinase
MMEQCVSVISRIDQTLTAVRRIATALRPSVLDQLGLAAALEWQGQEFRSRTGIDVEMDVSTDGGAIPDDIGSSAFRILQESLTNVARHAHAQHVKIRLEQTNSMLALEVSDDGIGAPNRCLDGTKSLGVVGMRERALACGGDFSIIGKPDAGTTVSLRVPLYTGLVS